MYVVHGFGGFPYGVCVFAFLLRGFSEDSVIRRRWGLLWFVVLFQLWWATLSRGWVFYDWMKVGRGAVESTFRFWSRI